LSRLAAIEPGTEPAAALVEARLVAARGEVSRLYRILMNSVAAADGWEYFLTIVRQKLSLSPRLREMVILRIATLNAAPYEFAAHVAHARAAGLSDGEIDALRTGGAGGFDDADAAVLAYADAMTRDIHVPDATFAAIAERFPPREVVDLTVTIAAYNMVSRVLAALGID
jgi:AhpD family alkylhydroperoxidase